MRNLRGYLALVPGAISFNELDLKSYECRQRFVGGSLERIELAEKIDIWVNENLLNDDNLDNVSIVIRSEEKIRLVFGKVFLATTDQYGHCVPLTKAQAKWLGANLLTGVKGDSTFYKIIDLQAASRTQEGLSE